MQRHRDSLTCIVCFLTLLVAVLAGMDRATAALAPAATTPIKIGVLAPFTGPLAPPARDIADGARLYVDEVNGEMVGRKVELMVEDYEFKAAVALTKTKKLVERDHSGGGSVSGHSSRRVSEATQTGRAQGDLWQVHDSAED